MVTAQCGRQRARPGEGLLPCQIEIRQWRTDTFRTEDRIAHRQREPADGRLADVPFVRRRRPCVRPLYIPADRQDVIDHSEHRVREGLLLRLVRLFRPPLPSVRFRMDGAGHHHFTGDRFVVRVNGRQERDIHRPVTALDEIAPPPVYIEREARRQQRRIPAVRLRRIHQLRI